MEKNYIPPQVQGKQLDIFEDKRFPSAAEAFTAFSRTRERLLDINRWHEYAGAPSAQFQLVDHKGAPVEGKPQIGHYIQIDIPGPGSPRGHGYDWVAITHMTDQPTEGFVQFTVSPSPPPQDDTNEVAHFFHQYASSTFQAEVKGDVLAVSYFGRNEQINLQNENISDTIRNAIIGLSAKLGFSYPQWKKLVQGLIENDNN
ncbi:hypothetical protein BC792_11673 [Sphingobacterium allocomposti]|uniref:Uncharacterized protein n=1 Tax=Sphingobacterium allocomposti TaxID=415956 RepID=A0A5S5D911_9SPHI|nr:hypothetical protein [Sphingobacterium composti Yoo et al. 2007 non Ten et al. 2007]TYP92471.1 hypothetical protein BC792_11673 [Sphingobacterium composti Yoo et al. 2007 non Ten et al. 2007]